MGDWNVIAQVPDVDTHTPGMTTELKTVPFRSITFKDDGTTDTIDRLWTGNTLVHLARSHNGGAAYQALKMECKTIGGADTLFIEAGGFDRKHGPDWKCPLLVLTRR